jgi:SAM-dependent methyltransferase
MGINAALDPLLFELSKRAKFSGAICTLGVMNVDGGADAHTYFSKLGFSTLQAVDISDFEGADHIFDLNEDELPAQLVNRFDAVFNGGTLEHVFHVPNALSSITRMLRPGGIAVHVLPCNGWVNHGFYQISPTLMFDYYEAAGFEPLESALYSRYLEEPYKWTVRPIRPGEPGDGQAGSIDRGLHLYLFAARRGEKIVERPRPTQWLYSGSTTPRKSARWFLPYTFENGVTRPVTVRTKADLENAQPERGHCWTSPLPKLADVSDDVGSPSRSTLLLFEDDQLLGPAHSSHQDIRDRGQGAYSHWGHQLYFSTSDNSNFNNNGRRYSAIVLE